ncbi:MAG TPA: glutathione S-transferase family protein [Steroidobacteraceae bacterium]|nr:glutathione S-transferase family protein [Steroidobacteraceae bacterium]
MKLYGNSLSPFVRKVLVFAAEKSLALDNVQIERPVMQEEFLRASPLRKMPALVDGDFSIADSTAIIAYLERKHPTPAMYPADAASLARAVWFEEFADTVLSGVVFKTFFNRVVAPKFFHKPGDEAVAVEGEAKDLPPLLNYLESVVAAPGHFLVGNRLGVADIAVASMFVNFAHAGIAVSTKTHPKTVAWLASILARPSFAGLIAAEKKLLAA